MDGLTLDQLNEIPEGFNNSILWNYGHIIVTQQLLCYKLTGNEMLVSHDLVEEYKKGQAPSRPASQLELDKLKSYGVSLIEQLEADYSTGSLAEFAPYETSFKVKLDSIEDTITFLSVHEGLHLGYAMSQRKSVI